MIFFGYYLVERGFVTTAQVLEALDMQHSKKIPIGKLARMTDRLTDEQVFAVLNQQKNEQEEGKEHRPFGQIAQEMGLLNEQDIIALLEEQAVRRRHLGEILVEMGAIDNATMQRELNVFFRTAGR